MANAILTSDKQNKVNEGQWMKFCAFMTDDDLKELSILLTERKIPFTATWHLDADIVNCLKESYQ